MQGMVWPLPQSGHMAFITPTICALRTLVLVWPSFRIHPLGSKDLHS